MKVHPLLQQLGIERIYIDEENPTTNAPDSVCIVLKDGHSLILNQIEKHGEYQGTEVVLWKDQGVVSIVNPVEAHTG